VRELIRLDQTFITAAGLPKPDISILSDQRLAEVRGLNKHGYPSDLKEKAVMTLLT
jgi:hypothetical protein